MSEIYLNNTTLIEALQNGDEKAYEYLIKIYNKSLIVYAVSLTNDHAMAKDIIQNVFIRTWEFRKKLNASYSIKGFLYKSAYNEFITLYHRKQSMMALEKIYVDTLNKIIEDTEGELEKKISLVTEEIENLPKKCKKTFLLSKKEGLTNIEIAEYLDIPVRTVESHISQAYSRLRENVKNKIKLIFFHIFGIKKLKKLF